MSDRYELLEEIGEGPLATVHRAKDLTTRSDVAVKVLHESVQADGPRLAQILDGIQAWAQLGEEDQDHLVRILDIDRQRGRIVLEYLSGNLARRLERGPLPADLVRSVLQQALTGLRSIHGHGRLHGAVKPANLLITRRGHVKLGESPGIDLSGGEVPHPEGLPKYVAPELFDPSFGKLGPPADLYALGLAALEMLVGPTFDSQFNGVGPDAPDPAVGWLRLHTSRNEPMPPTRQLAPTAPADLSCVIDRMLLQDAGDRYATADEALQDLEERELVLLDSEEDDEDEDDRSKPPPLPILNGPKPKPKPKETWKEWLETPLGRTLAIGGILVVLLLGLLLPFLLSSDKGGVAQVRITTDPPGAAIFLDGKDIFRETDVTLDNVAARKRTLRLVLQGYKPIEKEIALVPGENDSLHFDLERSEPIKALVTRPEKDKDEKDKGAKVEQPPPPPMEVTVRIVSQPPGAAVTVDGKPLGEAPCLAKVKPGSYPVRLTRPGYKTVEDQLVVQKGDDGTVRTFQLSQEGALINSVGMPLRRIPAGTFQRGSPVGEAGRTKAEGPLREVRITRPFFMGANEVTQETFEKVMGVNPSAFNRARGGGPSYPVDSVSYDMAVEFCKKLSEMPAEKSAGRVYRLPTEAEWEYACRAGSSTPFHTGRTLTDKQAAFDAGIPYGGASPGLSRGRPDLAAEGTANAWGLRHMHGNLWEWCSDWYDPGYYEDAPTADPRGPGKGDRRVLRGGAYNVAGRFCRSAARHADTPASRSATYGFRVVCEQR